MSVFLNISLIRLVWDQMAPAITQWGVVLNAARFILQTKVSIDC